MLRRVTSALLLLGNIVSGCGIFDGEAPVRPDVPTVEIVRFEIGRAHV